MAEAPLFRTVPMRVSNIYLIGLMEITRRHPFLLSAKKSGCVIASTASTLTSHHFFITLLLVIADIADIDLWNYFPSFAFNLQLLIIVTPSFNQIWAKTKSTVFGINKYAFEQFKHQTRHIGCILGCCKYITNKSNRLPIWPIFLIYL